jgi:hypothetical protein
MANVDAKLKVAELDFDAIKNNLKNFLRDQQEFSDYDFEGSGMSILLDILAYNTHYMGYYLNMVSNEMFLDTALNRDSVVSHAKLLGYTPRSAIASRATINVSFTPVSFDSNSAITIPRFTRFSSETKDGANYTFVTTSSRVISKNTTTGLFTTENLEIKEGRPVAITFTYDASTNPRQYFEIPDEGVDTSTLEVLVQKSVENSNQESYILSQDATNVSANSNVYYIEESKSGRYRIYFGDGVIGKKLENGNIVVVSYIVTSGTVANGVRNFKLIDNILTGSTVAITTASESTSGATNESIESIRYTAPKAFISQNRAVTKNDYIALINRDYPYFSAVNVWGGEENDPPVYGKVFFTAKPLGGYEITVTEVEFIKNSIIKPFSVLTVTPEYVPADYTYLNISVDVNFDPTRTNKTASEIELAVIAAINNFSVQNLNSFNNTFKVSQLSRAIDDSENSITSNDIKIVLEKRFAPDTTVGRNYTIEFGTELKQGTSSERLISTPSFDYFDSSGILRKCFIEEVLQSYTGIEDIEVTAAGSGYISTPTVIIEGDGEGATADALIVNGTVRKIQITNPGVGYTSAVARISGGGGVGALLRPVLQGRYGQLKIYTISNGVKKTVQENIGIIDYTTGRVVLNNFAPITISDPFGTLVLKASPTKKIFSSEKNRIVTLDDSDPTAISVTLNAIVER